MPKIKIEHFGPLKGETNWVDIKKVTTFIGNQGSGKSTVAKLISTFTWIEKALVRGDFNQNHFKEKGRFRKQYLSYHKLENYIKGKGSSEKTSIEYKGDAFTLSYKKGNLTVKKTVANDYKLPQIMYVPAERNFISNVKNPSALKLTSDSLIEFVTEFNNAKNSIKGVERLPINNVQLDYDRLNDKLNLKGEDYKVHINESSSGFQALVPLYLVSNYLAKRVNAPNGADIEKSSDELERFRKHTEAIWADQKLSDEQKRIAISSLSQNFNKSAFINIVEEPEQNLFPDSQFEILKKLLELNNLNKGNKLIMTTHSPYLINFLSLAIYSHELKLKLNQVGTSSDTIKKIRNAIDLYSTVSKNDVAVYEMSNQGCQINKLPMEFGIPSSQNFLNQSLKKGNQLFDQLLEIEQSL
jgi:predicted ATPase